MVKVLALEGNKIKLSRKAILKEQRDKLKGGDGASAPSENGDEAQPVEKSDRPERSERSDRPPRRDRGGRDRR